MKGSGGSGSKGRRGLRLLLGFGAALLLLIALSVVASAVDVQNKPMSVDQDGIEKNEFSTTDHLYGLPPSELGESPSLSFPVTYCVTYDYDWITSNGVQDQGLGALEAKGGGPSQYSYEWAKNEHASITGDPSCVGITRALSNTVPLIWEPLLTAGAFDIALYHSDEGSIPVYVDAKPDEGETEYTALVSADEQNESGTPGFTVFQAAVGGTTMTQWNVQLLAPWVGLGMLLVAGVGLTLLIRQRHT